MALDVMMSGNRGGSNSRWEVARPGRGCSARREDCGVRRVSDGETSRSRVSQAKSLEGVAVWPARLEVK